MTAGPTIQRRAAAQAGRRWRHSVREGEQRQICAVRINTPRFLGQFLALMRPLPMMGKVCLLLGQSLPSLNVLCAFPDVPGLDSASAPGIPGGRGSWAPVLPAAPSGSSPGCCCPRWCSTIIWSSGGTEKGRGRLAQSLPCGHCLRDFSIL